MPGAAGRDRVTNRTGMRASTRRICLKISMPDWSGRRRSSRGLMNEHPLTAAEEALRESEERFRGTFENAAVGIVHNDPSGRFLRVNEKYCAIVGYSREELLRK